MNYSRLNSYFTEMNTQKYLFYMICLVYVMCTSIIVIIEPFLPLPCDEEHHTSELEFENILFHYSICDHRRFPKLLFLTKAECERGRHLLAAVFFGSLIGYERRSSDRPAGIRTMALVSLGSALFTINSTFGFLEGPMAWDSSRVSASIPSGVGFLGAGLIVKSSEKDPITGESHHLVQGITTAAATWLSAAVGIACGGGLYFAASFSTALNLLLLRFGPRFLEGESSNTDLGNDATPTSRLDGTNEWTNLVGKDIESSGHCYGGAVTFQTSTIHEAERRASLARTASVRNRPTLM